MYICFTLRYYIQIVIVLIVLNITIFIKILSIKTINVLLNTY